MPRSKFDEVVEFLTEVPRNKKVVGGKRQVDAVTGPPHRKKKPKRLEPMIAKGAKALLEITGSLLQDVTIPAIEDLGENIQLFLTGGDLAEPVDPNEEEVNKFLSGGK